MTSAALCNHFDRGLEQDLIVAVKEDESLIFETRWDTAERWRSPFIDSQHGVLNDGVVGGVEVPAQGSRTHPRAIVHVVEVGSDDPFVPTEILEVKSIGSQAARFAFRFLVCLVQSLHLGCFDIDVTTGSTSTRPLHGLLLLSSVVGAHSKYDKHGSFL